MKTFSHLLRPVAALAVAAAFLAGCAELKDDLPAPTNSGLSVHEAGWADTTSAHFHGTAIASGGSDMRSCQECHGPDYLGGVSGVSCRTCHTGSAGPENCTTCHGGPNTPAPPKDVAGNTATTFPGVGAHAKHVLGGSLAPKVWCYECHTVPASVYVPGHVDSELPAEVPMNGPLARTATGGISPLPVHDYSTLTCANTYCHGDWRFRKSDSRMPFIYVGSEITGSNASPVWTGGSAEAGCGTCHALPPAGHKPAALTECVSCHSPVVDPEGAIADKSLHINGRVDVGFGEPVNCSACHGSPDSPAPPVDLAGDTATSAPGVGAHSTHVHGGPLSKEVSCGECHTVPSSVQASGHIDSGPPAEVPMNGPLARTATGGITPLPVHDYSTLTCANTYCHGNWKFRKSDSPMPFIYVGSEITGENASPVWNRGSAEAACGTCHALPPAGHKPAALTECVNCHTPVVDPEGAIADKSLHINGRVDVGFPEPVNCSACHGSADSPAPPADIAGDTATSAPGVGAHSTHLHGGPLSLAVSCGECHSVPSSVEAPGHIDSDLPAEVPMAGALARNVSDGVAPLPVHDPVALTCANVYCHGDWRSRKSDAPGGNQFAYMDSVIVGSNASPVWNGGASQAACGTCHGLPPAGHIPFAVTACVNCHDPVVDASGNIADKTLHINGKINVFGGERDF